MKIAVTFENGQVFQHFGHTETFKIYDIEDGKVVASEVIGSNGSGHGALAGLLAQQDIKVLICGGLGDGAKNALTEAGIEVFSGAQGNADAAVDAYLKGELVSAGVNCDHHHDESHDCTDAAVHRRSLWKERMQARPAVYTIKEPLTTEHSSILLMTVANRLSLSAVQA